MMTMRWLNTDVDIVDAECDLDADCADDPRSPPPRPHPPASRTSCRDPPAAAACFGESE